MEVERNEDDELKESEGEKGNEDMSENDLGEDEEDFFEDFYDERVKEYI